MVTCSVSQLDEEASVWSPGPAQGRVQFRLPAPQAPLRPDGSEVAANAHHIQVGVGEDDDWSGGMMSRSSVFRLQ